MGTRHLVAVQLDGEYKIAQYGQWDGYPSGQGASVLDFLKHVDHEQFKAALRECRWLDDQETKGINENFVALVADEGNKDEWRNKPYWYLSRSAGAKVLVAVSEAGARRLIDNSDFAKDSVFCEWAYVIDYDDNVLEVYEGFQKQANDRGRFIGPADEKNGYGPVQLRYAWRLDNLPSEEDFVQTLEFELEEAA